MNKGIGFGSVIPRNAKVNLALVALSLLRFREPGITATDCGDPRFSALSLQASCSRSRRREIFTRELVTKRNFCFPTSSKEIYPREGIKSVN